MSAWDEALDELARRLNVGGSRLYIFPCSAGFVTLVLGGTLLAWNFHFTEAQWARFISIKTLDTDSDKIARADLLEEVVSASGIDLAGELERWDREVGRERAHRTPPNEWSAQGPATKAVAWDRLPAAGHAEE